MVNQMEKLAKKYIENEMMYLTIELAVGSKSFEEYKQNFDELIKKFGETVNIPEDWLERLKRGGADVYVRSKLDNAEKIEDEEKREEEIMHYAPDLLKAAVYTSNKEVIKLVVEKVYPVLQKKRPDIWKMLKS